MPASLPQPAEVDYTRKRFVLVLCTGNSCRSQMAEAIVNTRLGNEWATFSAGTQPAGCVHPKAVESLAEIGIDWRGRSACSSGLKIRDMLTNITSQKRRE